MNYFFESYLILYRDNEEVGLRGKILKSYIRTDLSGKYIEYCLLYVVVYFVYWNIFCYILEPEGLPVMHPGYFYHESQLYDSNGVQYSNTFFFWNDIEYTKRNGPISYYTYKTSYMNNRMFVDGNKNYVQLRNYNFSKSFGVFGHNKNITNFTLSSFNNFTDQFKTNFSK